MCIFAEVKSDVDAAPSESSAGLTGKILFTARVKQILIDFHNNVNAIPLPEDYPALKKQTGLSTDQV